MAITSAFLLVASSIVHAEDREYSFLNLEAEQQNLHRVDMSMSLREYEDISSRNWRFLRNNLRSYSENALAIIGMPEQGINLMGAAMGLAFNDSRLNLNKSKTLAIEIKDVRDSDRTLYLGVNLDW
jgi:hypothetical protein